MLNVLSAKAKFIVIGGLVLALGTVVWMWRGEIEDRVRYAVQGAQMEQDLKDVREDLKREQRLRQEKERLAAELRERNERIRQRQQNTQQALDELEDEHEAVRKWADDRVPDPVLDRLRDGLGPATGDEDGN